MLHVNPLLTPHPLGDSQEVLRGRLFGQRNGSANALPGFDLLVGSSPPSGAAGGDLAGTYPNPTVKAENVALGVTPFLPRYQPGLVSLISTPVTISSLPALNGFTDADPALADILPGYDSSASANRDFLLSYLLAMIPGEPGGRLTPVTGNPHGQATSTTLYYTAFMHNIIVLWDGTRWIANQFTELSMSVAGFGGAIPYDIFCYLSGGTPTLEGVAWASKTARTTGITIQDGRYCLTGDKQRLYLGTVYNYSGSVVVSTGASSQIGIWNMHHRTRYALYCVDVTNSWTYTTATWRQSNASTSNQVEYVCGMALDSVTATATCHCVNSGSDMQIGPGIGVNSTSVNSAIIRGGTSESGKSQSAWAQWTGIGNAGFNYVAWLEQSTATTGTTTFYGDAGGIATLQTGLVAEVWA